MVIRLSAAALCALLLSVLVTAAHGAGEANVFAGNWTTSPAGTLQLKAVTQAEAESTIDAVGAQYCEDPATNPTTVYYVGTLTRSNTATPIAGCTYGPTHLVGGIQAADGLDFNIVYTAGATPTFAGSTTDAAGSYGFNGTFASHFDGDGANAGVSSTPVTTPPVTTTPPAKPGPTTPATPGAGGTTSGGGQAFTSTVTARTSVPALSRPVSFNAPSPGNTGDYKLPKIGPKARKFTAELRFSDNSGQAFAGPALVALATPRLSSASGPLCSILAATDAFTGVAPSNAGLTSPSLCVEAVERLQARADAIRAAQGEAAAVPATVSAGCRSMAIRVKSPRVQFTCAKNDTGITITIRARSAAKTLRQVLGSRARLTVSRSSLDAGATGDRLNVFWQASSKR